MVADITNIPVKDAAVDCILDLFTPANYGEFYRVLKSDGAVIKAVPGAHHMEQVRRIAAPYLHKETYSNEEVLEYFEQHFNLEKTIAVSATLEVSKEDLDDLIHMTPLLFDVDREMPELKEIEEITVEAEILVGRSQKNKR